ncbi:MAG: hypothetical protein CL843_17190 [Crocinitomicaceae bacterium]|nr:hypothetical protein [Crocinitomicaceae bacterium]|tara:strand:+ start:19232 stop:20671 length:1440 start_codon:yes stop_codon:yes gene_type:complete
MPDLYQKFEPKLLYGLLVFSGVYFIYLAYISEGSYGGADGYNHFFMAQGAYSSPILLLDLWGKPLFTLLASPFAQFGYFGIRVFNLLCGVLAALFAYKTARLLNIKLPILAAVLTLFGSIGLPIYLSGLTEPLFALVLSIATFFFVRKQFLGGALVISFLFLARTEGLLIMFLFAPALWLVNKQQFIPFLALGFFIYSIIGVFAFGNFFWIINDFPYGNTAYGTGDLLHFWNYRFQIFGYPFLICILIGFISFVLTEHSNFTLPLSHKMISWGLIILSFAGYFAAHSYVWWKGSGSSAGLIRVILGIFPSAAILAAKAGDLVVFIPSKLRMYVALMIVLTISYFQVQEPFHYHVVPTSWGVEEVEIQKAVNVIRANHLEENPIVYYNSIALFMLNKNPYVNHDGDSPLIPPHFFHHPDDLPQGTVIIYDSHFGPLEQNTESTTLLNYPELELLETFTTTTEHKGADGKPYKVSLFIKKL